MDIYDGDHFPFEDNSIDTVMFMDVLHHTNDAMGLLKEAARISRRSIVIKDHLCDSAIAIRILAFMDWIGNRSHGVALPYNYWSSKQWQQAWKQLGYEPDAWVTDIGLYPWFAKSFFENGLHFITRLPIAK
jgi:ubiquinone/menaquinone biosynthesis C-methylase UbiE